MRHRKQAAKARDPKANVAGFPYRVVRIGARQGQVIKENRGPFVEGNVMLDHVGRGFWRVPSELH